MTTKSQPTPFMKEIKCVHSGTPIIDERPNLMRIVPTKEGVYIIGECGVDFERNHTSIAFTNNTEYSIKEDANWHPNMIELQFKTIEQVEWFENIIRIVRRSVEKELNDQVGQESIHIDTVE